MFMAAAELLSIVPPFMIKVPATVPKADELLMFRVPADRVTPPVKVLVPESVRIPGLVLVILNKAPLVTELIVNVEPEDILKLPLLARANPKATDPPFKG